MLFNKNIPETFRVDFYASANERPDIMWRFTFPAIISSFGEWDFTASLSGLATPALIIQGTYDAVPLYSASKWNATLQNSRLWVVDDVGHMPFVEKQQEILTGISAFLDEPLN